VFVCIASSCVSNVCVLGFHSTLNLLFQGFEVVVAGTKYFAFSKFEVRGHSYFSLCDRTLPGWSHDMNSKNWACYVGYKTTKVAPKVSFPPQARLDTIQVNDIHSNNDTLILSRYKIIWSKLPLL